MKPLRYEKTMIPIDTLAMIKRSGRPMNEWRFDVLPPIRSPWDTVGPTHYSIARHDPADHAVNDLTILHERVAILERLAGEAACALHRAAPAVAAYPYDIHLQTLTEHCIRQVIAYDQGKYEAIHGGQTIIREPAGME